MIAFHRCDDKTDDMLDDPKVGVKHVEEGLYVRFSNRSSSKGKTLFETVVTFEDINDFLMNSSSIV